MVPCEKKTLDRLRGVEWGEDKKGEKGFFEKANDFRGQCAIEDRVGASVVFHAHRTRRGKGKNDKVTGPGQKM